MSMGSGSSSRPSSHAGDDNSWDLVDGCDDHANVNIDLSVYHKLKRRRVAKAELWERPLKGAGREARISRGRVHQGVVVTLDGGERYFVHKLVVDDLGGVVVVALAVGMGDKWEKVDEKIVARALLKDYIKACGQDYDLLTDNDRHAAKRLMALG